MHEDEKPVEHHHYHAPTLGQVTKALRQHLTEIGPSAEEIHRIVDKRVDAAMQQVLAKKLDSDYFEKFLLRAVSHFIDRERTPSHLPNHLSFEDRLAELIKKELGRLLADGYEVIVRPKAKPKSLD